jgi:hypothetical protein
MYKERLEKEITSLSAKFGDNAKPAKKKVLAKLQKFKDRSLGR